MKNLIVISLALAFCLPVNAEILVFKTKNSGQQLNTQTQIVEKKSEQGYLVLDVDMANQANIVINEAYHLTYGTTAGVKTQATIILDPLNVELILAANDGKDTQMILRWFDDPTGTYTVVFGKAKNTDIGGLFRSIASSAKGGSVWRLLDFMTGQDSISLKLDTTDTRSANTQSKTAIDTMEELSQSLIAKGYRSDL
jgi:hypothetical protein